MPKRKHCSEASLFVEHAGVKVYKVPGWAWSTGLDYAYSLAADRRHEVEPLDFDIRDLPGSFGVDLSDPRGVETLIRQAIENGGLERYTLKARNLAFA